MQVSQPPKSKRAMHATILFACLIGAAWTCHSVLAGHRVQSYSFEEALRLVQQGNTDPSRACSALRARIVEAVHALRQAGPDGTLAIEAIHKESRP